MNLHDRAAILVNSADKSPRTRPFVRITFLSNALILLLMQSAVAADPQVLPPEESSSGQRLVVRVPGLAQDGGVPHLDCQQLCCRNARTSGLRLGPAAAAVHGQQTNRTLLREATSSIEVQLAMLPASASPGRPVDRILLTAISSSLGAIAVGTICKPSETGNSTGSGDLHRCRACRMGSARQWQPVTGNP